MDRAPSMEAWRDLYGAALRFKDLECWHWMQDSDVFAVEDPESADMGYCCVMGALGEMFALSVYLGAEGLATYVRLAEAEAPSEMEDALLEQRCLMASFGDREELNKQDLEVIKGLGLRFRGRNSWPRFRSHLPGYFPWHLAADETTYLTVALQQAVEVAARAKADPGLLTSRGQTRMLARVVEKEGGAWRWRDEWISPLLPAEVHVPAPLDEVRLKKIKNSLPQRPMTWEVDLFYLPVTVTEGERPYYPPMLMCVEQRSGFIFGSDIMGPGEHAQVPVKFQGFLAKVGTLPTELAFTRERVMKLLEPTASALGIKVRRVKKQRMLEEAKESLVQTFTRGRPW